MAGEDRDMETETETGCPGNAAGRFAAGEDPAKREQILAGAWRVFKRKGFDAASMNDITREAGVSKGTIYVYFSNKEDLFVALVDHHRNEFATSMRHILEGTEEVREGLEQFGKAFANKMICSDMIPAMRSVLGVIDRMPKLAQRFFLSAPNNVRTVLLDFIQHQVEIGHLKVDDPELAARQYIELSTGTFFKLRLFGELEGPVPDEELDRVISSAINVFMAAYGTDKA
ncbi:TetR/AcrR family transcriptional regulator [Rhizobium pusense]|jgi:AcrR family transcriptional regulator|uniref:TetR/AcrR family transcriptional regulator n=3 Tax=Hyphomicrobiales TaxID=356 RepID=A0A1L9CQB3_9HYPH|nr:MULTISPECIES: TetR/AcrR family transcriptional regulator [Rhizobium/Agrobacterium group]AMD58491.1 TetR family transcriptional regulator [Agrobacterium tumefaciens]ANV27229.1 TetR family transcriptional regulator [Rhizobium sp. S41]AUC11576.1 TetR family transcriptional regulator [Rhizobium sp. Y9]KGE81578.1 TetR family transcriptional regulator [Rhizobium sp. H41]KIV66720.1 Transcriptional regulator, TetR family [Rhizobium sp. UR51a]MBB2906188.1 AcrR family transcriptional regulator [Rhiz